MVLFKVFQHLFTNPSIKILSCKEVVIIVFLTNFFKKHREIAKCSHEKISSVVEVSSCSFQTLFNLFHPQWRQTVFVVNVLLSFSGEVALQNLINHGNLYFKGSLSSVLFCSNHQSEASDKSRKIS